MSIAHQIQAYAARLPEGRAFQAKELLHLGSRSAVDQALARLAKTCGVLRLERGVYMAASAGGYGRRTPSPRTAIKALSAITGEQIAPHGSASANALGLTTQVPLRPIYLTSGRSRRLKLGRQSVELRHAPGWQLMLPEQPAGEAVRALAWLGPERAPDILRTLETRLSNAQLRSLVEVRGRLPTWLAQEISRLNHA
jgi:hypothetical protein